MAVLKKVLAFLLGDQKGRKFLGYVIGIALVIVLLPVIAIYGLFGWMSGSDAAGIIGYDVVYENLPTEIREQIDTNSEQLAQIETVFEINGLSDQDIAKAKLIYSRTVFSQPHEVVNTCMRASSKSDSLLKAITGPFCLKKSLFQAIYNDFFGDLLTLMKGDKPVDLI